MFEESLEVLPLRIETTTPTFSNSASAVNVAYVNQYGYDNTAIVQQNSQAVAVQNAAFFSVDLNASNDL